MADRAVWQGPDGEIKTGDYVQYGRKENKGWGTDGVRKKSMRGMRSVRG